MRARTLILAACVLLLAVVPLIATLASQPYYIDLLRRVMIFAIAAASLNLILGYGGLVSFGHAAYLGVGGYAVGILAFYGVHNGWLQWAVAIAASALVALAIGAISVRTRGIYFIMVTLAFAQMVYFVFHDTKLGGGSDGIYIYNKPAVKLGETALLNLEDQKVFYWFVLGLMVAVYLVLRRVLASNFGHVLVGIKTNEHRMKALGFNTFRYKLAGYVFSGALAGLAGYLAALQFGFTATSVVSSGNAGSSIAAYSARAGLRSLIFSYERASAPKLLHMAATASDLVLYAGRRKTLRGCLDLRCSPHDPRGGSDEPAASNAHRHPLHRSS